jgi:hypothetical protein
MSRIRLIAGWALAAALWAADAAWACPGCKEALFDPAGLQERLAAARGMAASILLMLAVPVALIGGIAFGVARSARRRQPPPVGGSH